MKGRVVEHFRLEIKVAIERNNFRPVIIDSDKFRHENCHKFKFRNSISRSKHL